MWSSFAVFRNENGKGSVLTIDKNRCQLKGRQRRIGNQINDGAFEAMMEAIQTDRTPNFYFMKGATPRIFTGGVWTALLACVLLRFFALFRPAFWQNWKLRSLLEVYGTAGSLVGPTPPQILKPTLHFYTRFSVDSAPLWRGTNPYWLAM